MAEVPDAAAAKAARQARSRKQRILWDSDNATPDGKTSIGILLEWLTAPGNYERWRDGKAQFGETREKLCTEINNLMKKHGILHRENANIRTQISELERSYDAAVAWLVQNGFEDGQLPELLVPSPTATTAPQDAGPGGLDGTTSAPSLDGVTTSSANPAHHAEVQVLRLCRYFHVLSVIMRQPTNQPRARRPYNRSLSSSSANGQSLTRRTSQSDGVVGGDNSLGDDDSALDTASDNGHDAASEIGNGALAAGSRKRKMAAAATQPVLAAAIGGGPSALPSGGASAAASSSVLMNSNNFASFENTQRMLLDAAREDRERKRFQLDEERNKLECEKLRYEIEATKLELTVQRALARQKLLAAGVDAAAVEAMLTQASTLPASSI